MILVRKSPTADTRTCDVTKVTREQLLNSSAHHIVDVNNAMRFFQTMLGDASERHDYDKLSDIDWFYGDFITGFKQTGWWDKHRQIHRHHLNHSDGVPHTVNLIDVLEYISDCVMAGMARSGSVYDIKLDAAILEKAFQNTVELLKNNVKVEDGNVP